MAAGVVTISGTLAMLIPPSMAAILYGLVAGQSIGKFLVAGIILGILVMLTIAGTVVFMVWREPHLAPRGQSYTWAEKIASLSVTAPMVALVMAVTASIYLGVATPTEAACLDAFGALLAAMWRKQITLRGFCDCLARYAGRPLEEIFAGVFPHVVAHLGLILLFVLFPSLVMWLPNSMGQYPPPFILEKTMMRLSLCATASLIALLSIPTQSQAQTRLRVADTFPTSHFISTEGAVHFMEAAKRLSGGSLQFDYFPTQQLGAAADMLELASAGGADISYVVPSYAPDLMPLSSVAELPGMVTSSCQGTKAYWAMLQKDAPIRSHEYDHNNVVPLWGFTLPAYQIGTTKYPLETIEDLRGLKIRAAGGAFELALRSLGAVPVRMSAPEVRESILRGTLDGSVSPAVSLKPYDRLTVVGHMTQGASFGGFVGTYSMNRDVFEQLDPS